MIGRLLTATVVLGAAAAVAVAAARAPMPDAAGDLAAARSVATLPVAGAGPQLVCPGPETLSVPAGADPLPAGPTVLSALAGTPAGDGTGLEAPGGGAVLAPLDRTAPGAPTTPLAVTGAGGAATARQQPQTAGAWGLQARSADGAQVPLAALDQSTWTGSGELRGLTTHSCLPAQADSWLVGGGTGTLRRANLLLANPAPSVAAVSVSVLGPDGPVPTPTLAQLSVPAGGQVSVYLDAVAPGLPAMAVHVHARTGRVAATMMDSLVRGLVPGGTDDVAAAPGPATSQVLPGVSVRAPAHAGRIGPAPTAADQPGASAVRIAVPGTQDAVVRLRLLGPDGPVSPTQDVITVASRTVADVLLAGVPDGDYTVLVSSDVPVVAGGLVGRSWPGGELAGTPAGVAAQLPPAELAWVPAGQPLTTATLLALPARPGAGTLPAPSTTLTLAGADAAAAAVQVSVLGPDPVPAPVTLSADADRTAVLTVPPGATGLLLRPVGGRPVLGLVTEGADAGGPYLGVAAVPATPPQPGAVRAVEDLRLGLR